MNRAERLEALEAALDHLRRHAAGNLVLVEGQKDLRALEALGVGGEHVRINRGRAIADRADEVAERAEGRTVIVLTDWDRTGGRLARAFHDGLVGRVPVDLECRRRLAHASHEVCVERIPAELAGLRGPARASTRNWRDDAK